MTGEQLKKRRIKIGLTQAKLAETLDIQPNTVYRYESGLLEIPKAIELAFERIEQKVKEQLDNL
jgi:transcriptional regulator with XRE-family HTH domain